MLQIVREYLYNLGMAKVRKKKNQKLAGLALDVGAFSKLLQGKPIRKPFSEIDDLADYFDALSEFARVEYASSDINGEHGFLGFINEEIRVRISNDIDEVVSRNKFGSSVLEILIPFKPNESSEAQDARKLFYHTQFLKSMKASQADLAHVFYSMLEPTGVKTLLQKYGSRRGTQKGKRS